MDLNNWQRTYQLPFAVDDGETTQEYRLTFGTCNNLDIGVFNRRRSKAWDAMRTLYGDDWLQNDEAAALHNLIILHAVIMAGLKKVELKTEDTWADAKLPDAWYDPQRFATEVPAGLIDTLVDAVTEAGNPMRLFSYLPVGDEEKKALRLTVMPSAS